MLKDKRKLAGVLGLAVWRRGGSWKRLQLGDKLLSADKHRLRHCQTNGRVHSGDSCEKGRQQHTHTHNPTIHW